MARDYQHRANPKKKRRIQRANLWKWTIFLLLTGLFIAFLIHLSGEDADVNNSMSSSPTEQEQKKAKTEQPKETSKPHYEFYSILPEMEIIIPESEIKTKKFKESIGKAETGRYVLQIGSFREPRKAEKLKAQLALLGVEAKIEKSYVGNTTWNRVNVGPFSKMEKVDRTRKRLRENRIDAVVVRTR